MSDSEGEGERVQYKVILLGDGAVGKTSITRRFTNDEFKQSYLQTIGVDWSMKTIVLPGEIEVTLQIWDIGGQQLGSKMLSNYIYGSDAVILTYDTTSFASFKNLQEWYQLVQVVFKDRKPTIAVMGNKSDLNHLRNVKKEAHTKWCTENDFLNFYVSAKTGDSVQSSFIRLAGVLAQVSVPKATIEGMGKVVKAEIVNYPITDNENEDWKKKHEEEVEKKRNKKCIIA
ncbi:hypothetical protein AKO1_013516 [Acrasis kona]|uniref:Ras-related protein Rab-28 n=1 Tax=Acrasis kona TaxID=1008807 RepID=A0AAW2ZGF0_9EUKA